jgi:hypothetical protein
VVNSTWAAAITDISAAAYQFRVARCEPRLREALLVKIYGSGFMSFTKIAKDVDCDAEVVSKHYRALHKWLMGQRGMVRQEGAEGIDPLAWAAAETVLRDAGIVG